MNRIMGRGDREAVTVFCLFESPDWGKWEMFFYVCRALRHSMGIINDRRDWRPLGHQRCKEKRKGVDV